MPSPEPEAVNAEDLIDPAFLERLRTLFVKLRRRRRLRRVGQQASPVAGHTREFKDHRPYARGDDWRAIDWRLYARLDKLFIRIFEEVQEFHVHLVLDTSASMIDPYAGKRRDAVRLTVALAYLALANQHRVSLHRLGQRCSRELPPLKGQGHIHQIIGHCTRMDFGGAADLDSALASFRPGGDRRGVVFLISDLLGADPQRSIEALRRARGWPAETHVVQIVDPAEAEPELEGELRLVDVESGTARRLFLSRLEIDRYRRAFAAFCDGIERSCAGSEIGYLRWSTAEPFEDQFVRLMARGAALGGA